MGIVEGVASMADQVGDGLAKALSPARIVFVSFIIVVSLKVFTPTKLEFYVVCVVYVLVDIFHNDFLRPYLNGQADWLIAKKLSH